VKNLTQSLTLFGVKTPRDETFTLYPKPQKASDTPKIQITRDGAIWYSPRGVDKLGAMDKDNVAAFGVLYPDMDKITTLAAYYVNGPPGYTYKLGSPAGRNSQ
jgi:hypothetical protein